MSIEPPLALLAELSHRCPMRCVYCSNPLELEPASRELDTSTWRRILDEAAETGVLQVHFSGGEPTVRKDLEELVSHAASIGIYTNLITSGVLLDRDRLRGLAEADLEHVQLSFQDTDGKWGDAIGGLPGAHTQKLAVAKWIREAGLSLTINAVIQRHNAARVGEMIDLAVALDAARLEVASVQYYGWGLKNRGFLFPSVEQLEAVTAVVEAARQRLVGVLVIDHVIPDYHARLPKACMGGWGRQFINVDPVGRVLPCHAAGTIPDLVFDTVFDAHIETIWRHSPAFERFRGTDWMKAPCATCDRREVDWGGCRCQALALTGDAANADPVCHLSPFHDRVREIAALEADSEEMTALYRGAKSETAIVENGTVKERTG